MKIDFILGFLGSGKTTLIKKFLEEGVFDEKVVIIENEFGEVGIDGSFLKNHGIEIRELTSGCICCTLKADFQTSLQEVVEMFSPDRLLIEPSGIATTDVLRVAENFAVDKLGAAVNMRILVIDVKRYDFISSYFGDFFIDQVKRAKTIILSRTQQVSQEIIDEITASLKKINAIVPIITTPWDQISAKEIVEIAERPNLSGELDIGLSDEELQQVEAIEFDNWGIETSRTYSEEELKEILSSFENKDKFGFVMRSKGILCLKEDRWVQFDYVLGEYEIRDSKPFPKGMVAVIGTDLNKPALAEAFS